MASSSKLQQRNLKDKLKLNLALASSVLQSNLALTGRLLRSSFVTPLLLANAQGERPAQILGDGPH